MKRYRLLFSIAALVTALVTSLPVSALDAAATAERFRALGIKLDSVDATPERVATARAATIELRQRDVTVADMAMLAAMPGLASVTLHETVTHEQIAALAAAPALTSLSFGGRPNVNDDSIAAIAAFPRLRHLRLGAATGFSPRGLAPLARASGLERLSLNRSRAPIADFSFLANLQKLTELELIAIGSIDDDALVHVGAISGLRSLNLSTTNVTDKGIAHLRGLKGLTTLVLDRTRLTPAAMATLGELNGLATITLGGPLLTDVALPPLPALHSIYVYDSPIADVFAESLSLQSSVSTVYLSNTRITDAAIKHIASIPNLRNLVLIGGALTDSAFSGPTFREAININLSGNVALTDAVLAALAIQPKLTSLDVRRTRVSKEGVAAALAQRPAGLPALRILN